ncbi:hypothetical protein KGY63_00695 [Candidatus Bipolaricaulota bacterium]|nr:hypothetical protein [Candidatus Bipolaricaulota bacterium]MBS3792781.1 hypothetical protein [Candidatus Bipolaricaulota bacterium]MBS3813886.1 hypothetical protein [Candidatus Bipolaricaulota bacterium]
MRVYFSHPTFTFRTRTETTCVEIIDEVLDPDEIVNPTEYGLKDDLKSIVHGCDVVVGMAIENKYTFLVWNEMEEGKEHGADIYTIRVKNKENIGELEKGFQEGTKRLSQEETDKFTGELLKQNRSSFLTLLFGNWGRRF